MWKHIKSAIIITLSLAYLGGMVWFGITHDKPEALIIVGVVLVFVVFVRLVASRVRDPESVSKQTGEQYHQLAFSNNTYAVRRKGQSQLRLEMNTFPKRRAIGIIMGAGLAFGTVVVTIGYEIYQGQKNCTQDWFACSPDGANIAFTVATIVFLVVAYLVHRFAYTPAFKRFDLTTSPALLELTDGKFLQIESLKVKSHKLHWLIGFLMLLLLRHKFEAKYSMNAVSQTEGERELLRSLDLANTLELAGFMAKELEVEFDLDI